MAIVSLGNFVIAIGAAPTVYNGFAVNEDSAYLIQARCTVENPNNIYSIFRIRPLFTNTQYSDIYSHHFIELPVTTRSFIFLLPFSKLYNGDGAARIEVERVSITPQTSDNSGEVTLELLYDDENDEKTWL